MHRRRRRKGGGGDEREDEREDEGEDEEEEEEEGESTRDNIAAVPPVSCTNLGRETSVYSSVNTANYYVDYNQ